MWSGCRLHCHLKGIAMSRSLDDTATSAGPPLLRRVSARETRRSTGLAFFAGVVAVYDFILFGTLLPRISEGFGWSTSRALLVSTLVSVGTAVVVFAVGPLVDRFGRRRGMMLTVAGTAVSSAATAATAGATSLVAVRAISGLSLSEQSVNATYLNELYAVSEDEWVRRNRGFVFSFVQAAWPVGAVAAAGFVSLVAMVWGADQWRLTFLLAALPAVVIALLCRKLRETPQFEAQKRVDAMRRAGDVASAREHAAAYGLEEEVKGGSFPLRAIFRGTQLRNTVVLSVAWIVNWFGIQTFSVLGTTVLEEGKGISAGNSLLLVMVSNLVGAAGYIVHGWAGDRFGRRNVVVVGWLLGGVFFAALLLGPSNAGFVMVTYMAGLFFLLGPYAALMFFQAECYTTECRATGGAFVYAMSQPGAIVGGFLLTVLTGASVGYSTAALVVGALGTFVSGLVMMGAKRIAAT
jgi:MFS family permease